MDFSDSLIAIVERDPALRRALGHLLQTSSLVSVAYPDLDAVFSSPLRSEVGCLVVDLPATGLAAKDLLRRLGVGQWTTPVVLLGHSEGAPKPRKGHGRLPVACLPNPFDPAEFLGLIRVQLATGELR